MVADCVYRGDRYQLSAHVPGGVDAGASQAAASSAEARPRGGRRPVRHPAPPLSSDRVVEVARRQPPGGRHGRTRSPPAIAEGWRASGFGPCDRVVLGLTTAPADWPSQDRLCRHVNAGIGAPEVWLADDAVTAHAGALSLGWGVSVTAGTGVACLAVPETASRASSAATATCSGDEGGAFWIGREGLRAASGRTTAADRRPRSLDAAARRFDGLDDLGARLHAPTGRSTTSPASRRTCSRSRRPATRSRTAIADAAADELVIARAGGRRGRRGRARRGRDGAGRARRPAPGRGAVRCATPRRTRSRAQHDGAAIRTADGSPARRRAGSSAAATIRGATRSSCTSGRGRQTPGGRRERADARPGSRYLARRGRPRRATLETTEWPSIDAAADLIADAIASGRHGPRLRHRPLPHARGGAVLPRRRPRARAADPVRGADAPRAARP